MAPYFDKLPLVIGVFFLDKYWLVTNLELLINGLGDGKLNGAKNEGSKMLLESRIPLSFNFGLIVVVFVVFGKV